MFKKVYKYILQDGHLKGETPDFPTFEDGRRELFLCEQIVKSAKENKWVVIE
jgi:predicted dehydrogenase